MKVEVNSQALADAVAWTTRVIDARPASPILAGIRLEAILRHYYPGATLKTLYKPSIEQ